MTQDKKTEDVNCTTHHHACDCREAKFQKLREENEDLRTALEFYCDTSEMNHGIEINECPAYVSEDDFEPLTVMGHHFLAYGKHAREVLAKYPRGE